MDIIIGRDDATLQWHFKTDNTEKSLGQPGSVSPSVSRTHCRLVIDEQTAVMTLTNLNPANVTLVNGMGIETKYITGNETVELGIERSRLDWALVGQFYREVLQSRPKKADIRHLQYVWQQHHATTMKLNSDERKFNALSRGIPILTIGSTFGAVFGGQKLLILSVIAFVLSLIIFIKAMQDASKTVRKRDELNHRFMHDYTCPICRHFFGNYPYDVLVQNTRKCSQCGAELIK
ncbi:MAG: FHA domain-containing protein [Prevotella sp.]|nr:FHA domain-containing protein [Prevotella sp.]